MRITVSGDVEFNVGFPILFCLFVMLLVCYVMIRTLIWTAAYIFWGFATLFLLILGFIVLGSLAGAFNSPDPSGFYVNAGVAGVFLFILIMIIAFNYTEIQTSIELIKEASMAVSCSNACIFFPLVSFLVRAILFLTTATFCFGLFVSYADKRDKCGNHRVGILANYMLTEGNCSQEDLDQAWRIAYMGSVSVVI